MFRYIGIGIENKLFCFIDVLVKVYLVVVYLYFLVGRIVYVNLVFFKVCVVLIK